MVNRSVIEILVKHDLKITTQRIAILEVIMLLDNHPDAEAITDYLRLTHPSIALATIYKTLDTFTKKGIIKKVLSSNESMRFDAIQKRHHHLYCSESDRVEDFYDDNLTRIIDEYLKKKKIPNFKVEDVVLQITGKFTDMKK
jgi:Fur family transcriptional regulator, peroxide stress response regulator